MCTLVSIRKSLSWGNEIEGVGTNRIVVCRFSESMSGESNDFLAQMATAKIGESHAVGTMSFDLNAFLGLQGDDWTEKADYAMKNMAKALCGDDVETSLSNGVLNVNANTSKVNMFSFSIKSLLDVDEVTITSTNRTLKTRKWCEFVTVGEQQAFEKCKADAYKQVKSHNWKLPKAAAED